MNFQYIVVQAGGKGTRMDVLTRNKPKALVPVDNLPMLFHLFRKYPDKKFIVIGDYKYDVLEKYLAAFASEYDYRLVCASGRTGTCAGLSEAFALLPEDAAFMLIWSDLVLKPDFSVEALPEGDYIGLSGDFKCRWKYEDHVFAESPSYEYGVAGLFLFRNKAFADDLPESGEFVRWLSEKPTEYGTLSAAGTKEYGLISEYRKLQPAKCRPFNRLTVLDGKLMKTGIDANGRALAVREKAWYQKVQQLGFGNIPQIYSYEPFTMELIDGKNIYEYTDLDDESRKQVIDKLVRCLKQLHSYEQCSADRASFDEAYLGKTFARLEKIKGLVPFADREYIVINGRKCRNVFFCRKEVEQLFEGLMPEKFVLLHGDCTFSNMMLRNETLEPVLIDPRGYFGKTELYGDPAYDWAKLYYSVAGNYDLFNLKKFDLDIRDEDVTLKIESDGWEHMADYLLSLVSDEVSERQIKAIHAIIWLSLTTYAWEDYDSVCGAFYNGLLYLEEVL